jgi:hypothetical protein
MHKDKSETRWRRTGGPYGRTDICFGKGVVLLISPTGLARMTPLPYTWGCFRKVPSSDQIKYASTKVSVVAVLLERSVILTVEYILRLRLFTSEYKAMAKHHPDLIMCRKLPGIGSPVFSSLH